MWIEDFESHLGILATSSRPQGGDWSVCVDVYGISWYYGSASAKFENFRPVSMLPDRLSLGAEGTAMLHRSVAFLSKLLACKNVRAVSSSPARKPGKRRQLKRPAIEWRVVEITKGRKTYRMGGPGSGSRSPSRHHVVGGHFKTFGEERPLLGSIVGTFWWGSFARGSRKLGTLQKLYADNPASPLLPPP